MSKYDTSSVKTFDNEALEVAFENQLTTRLDMMQFATPDYSLAEQAGMKKKIRKYSGNGIVEELAMGYGNTEIMGSSFVEEEYEVGVTQGHGQYYDEQIMNDPAAIDKLVQYMNEAMTNDLSAKIVAEMGKTTHKDHVEAFNFDVVSDAISEFPDEVTESQGLFCLIARKDATAWRKALKNDLSYVEAFVRKGYIGTVCGVPMYWSDAVPQGKAFVGTKEAITVFIKKGVEVEQARTANTRLNDLFIRKVALVALTNDAKLIEITTADDPRDNYNLLAEAPADWSTDYNDYYQYDVVKDVMVKNAFDAAPTFVANKYWEAKA